ncbi:heavy metal-binding domain-containing protein [Phaeodactylibacter xiamenensis]|uniref:heavy metal-binding domain-containing protein n=1 Tax=Phaeodactylibacter xiamenensis TaxID=1524460 RepID=UPI003BA8C198
MTNNKFLIRLLPVLALSFFIVSCGGNADTAGDEAATDQTEHTHEDGHMHDGDHMEADADKQGPEYTSAYICPMHCDGSGSDEPGECPVCGMDYVKNENMPADGHMHEEGDDHHHEDGHGHDHEGHNH